MNKGLDTKQKSRTLYFVLSTLSIIIILFLASCAHAPISPLPGSIHTIKVQMFKNETYQYGMEEKLTNLVIEELLADGRVKIVNDADNADAVLSGTITNYTRNILAADRSGNVDLYQITLHASVILKQTKTNTILRQNKNISSTTTYVPKQQRIEFERELDARNRLLSDLAVEIVSRMLDWKSVTLLQKCKILMGEL